jgi:hypothetical protein
MDELKLPLDTDVALCCPSCGEPHSALHHGGVDVYWRNYEDSPIGTKVRNEWKAVDVTNHADMEMCPSSRRSGLYITFNCETCGTVEDLAIVQHKGTTYISWVDNVSVRMAEFVLSGERPEHKDQGEFVNAVAMLTAKGTLIPKGAVRIAAEIRLGVYDPFTFEEQPGDVVMVAGTKK